MEGLPLPKATVSPIPTVKVLPNYFGGDYKFSNSDLLFYFESDSYCYN